MLDKLKFLLLGFSLIMNAYAFSQSEPQDKIVMLNGEEKVGQVTEMGDTYVKFVHRAESLVYTIKKEEINKIQFASGRIEFISKDPGKSTSEEDSGSQMQEHHNVVAVLPFMYIGQGGSRDEKLGIRGQSECYNVLTRTAKQFTIQDPIATNALLSKKGINDTTLPGFTPEELATLLNVEYVIYGMITVNVRGASSSSGGYYSGETKGKKTQGILLGSSSTTTQFSTNVDLKIYNDHGQSVFSQSHDSFWQTEDAFEITLQYLVKRSPLYYK